MFKTILASAAVMVALSGVANAADEMMKTTCDEANMKMMSDAMAKDTDPKMADGVKKAGEEMKMAMESMKANKMDECSKHMGMAMDSMMMKHN